MHVLRAAHHRRMPWRNGGGVTYEIASSPPAAGIDQFDWRISMAEVAGGGPFSVFAGIDRTLILIEGEWMALTVDGKRHRFELHTPFRFDGDSETRCEVPGPSLDLNVMTRRGRAVASVAVMTADASERRAESAGSTTAFVCLTPTVRLSPAAGAEIELEPLDAALTTDPAPLAVSGEGTVVVISFVSLRG